jgi:hypothetical protein
MKRVMMKKKLVPALLLFASTIALSPAVAQARGYHHHGSRHAVRTAHAHGHHVAAVRNRHRHVRHASRFGRRDGSVAVVNTGRPRAWCGWWLSSHLGLNDRKLWLASNWASVGHSAGGPEVGVVVVWRHHVGIITGRSGNGWVIKSGNDGHAVRERVRSIAGAIAFRRMG